jgi:hypothetical protein
MYEVTKTAVQDAIIDLGMAFRAFFEKRGRVPALQAQGRARVILGRQRSRIVPRRRKRIKLPAVVGWVPTLALSQRMFSCDDCGFEETRDVNTMVCQPKNNRTLKKGANRRSSVSCACRRPW